MKWLKEFLQKLGVVKLAKGGEIVGPGNSEDKVGPFILPPGKAVLNSMTVTINGEDFSEYVKDVEVNYVEPPSRYPSTEGLIHWALQDPCCQEELARVQELKREEQRKWEVGQMDTQPLPVIDAPYAKEEGWNEERKHEHVHWARPDDDDPITPGGTWPDEMDCE